MSVVAVETWGTYTRLADALSVPDGGFSYDPKTGNDVAAGYAVSVFPQWERKLAGVVTSDDLATYMADHDQDLQGHGRFIGGWRNPDDGVAYLDVSLAVKDKASALKLARDHGQLAIWDFANATSIPTTATVTA